MVIFWTSNAKSLDVVSTTLGTKVIPYVLYIPNISPNLLSVV